MYHQEVKFLSGFIKGCNTLEKVFAKMEKERKLLSVHPMPKNSTFSICEGEARRDFALVYTAIMKDDGFHLWNKSQYLFPYGGSELYTILEEKEIQKP